MGAGFTSGAGVCRVDGHQGLAGAQPIPNLGMDYDPDPGIDSVAFACSAGAKTDRGFSHHPGVQARQVAGLRRGQRFDMRRTGQSVRIIDGSPVSALRLDELTELP
jgi:hypothetical protein